MEPKLLVISLQTKEKCINNSNIAVFPLRVSQLVIFFMRSILQWSISHTKNNNSVLQLQLIFQFFLFCIINQAITINQQMNNSEIQQPIN